MKHDVLLKVKVHANANETRVIARGPDSYEAWVRAPAERGLANAAVLSALAVHLKVETRHLRIVKGSHSPAKIIAVFQKKPDTK